MLSGNAIERQLVELRRARAAIDTMIEMLQKELVVRTTYKLDESNRLWTGAKSEDLRPYIQEWIDQGYTLQALADKAGMSEKTVRSVLSGGLEFVKEATADRLITALNINHRYDEIVLLPPESKYWED